MGQSRENAALGEEALVQRIGGVGRFDQLDGDAVVEVVAVAIREIDRAHAAAPDLRDDAVGADPHRDPHVEHAGDRGEIRRELVHDAGGRIRGEQGAHLFDQVGIDRAPLSKQRRTAVRRAGASGREQVLQLVPALAIHRD